MKTVNNFSTRVSDRLSKYRDIISEASEKYGVPENIIKGIITAESMPGNPMLNLPSEQKDLCN